MPMRHQLDGTGYKANADAMKITDGCPTDGCNGYELTKDLDFKSPSSYGAGNINTAWTTGDGWEPIGTLLPCLSVQHLTAMLYDI